MECKIKETTPDSVEGVKARMMKLTQQIHDSMTDEQSPLATKKEIPKLPAGKQPFGWKRVDAEKKGIQREGNEDMNGKRGKHSGGKKRGSKVGKKVDVKLALLVPSVEAAGCKKRRAKSDPLVHPSMKASEVKRRTGFSSSLHLIAYIITICNGDFEPVQRRNSSMYWFEEWFAFFK